MKKTAEEYLRLKKIVNSEIEWIAPLLTEFAQQVVEERDEEIEIWINNEITNSSIHTMIGVKDLKQFLKSKNK